MNCFELLKVLRKVEVLSTVLSGLNCAKEGENIIFRREAFLILDLVADLVPIEFVLPVWSTSFTYVRSADCTGGGVMLEGVMRHYTRRFGV